MAVDLSTAVPLPKPATGFGPHPVAVPVGDFLPLQPSQVVALPTAQGWELPVRRFAPVAMTHIAAVHPPVVLCPPFGATQYLFSARGGGDAFVDVMLHRGREVWTFDYRGQDGTRATNGAASPTEGVRADHHAVFWEYAGDLAAVVEHVCTTTGAATVDLVGCSMGGVVAAVYAACIAPDRVRKFATIGTPFAWSTVPLWASLLTFAPRLWSLLPTHHVHRLARGGAPALDWVPDRLRPGWARSDNLDLGQLEELRPVVGSFPPRLNATVAAWVKARGAWVNGRALLGELHALRGPFFAVVGAADRLAPRENVEPVLAALGTPAAQRHLHEVPGATHHALMLGRHAATHVFVPVAAFLTRP